MNDDVDLVRHVATERGVRYFHKPIGDPIGGGGRGVSKVSLKAPAYMVGGKGYDEFGVALNAARSAFDLPTQKAPSGPAGPSGPSENAAAVFRPQKFTPRAVPRAKGAPSADDAIRSLRNRAERKQMDLGDVIAKSASLTPEDMASAKAFWDQHKPTPEETQSLASDLGLNPAHTDKSIAELRKAIKSRKTSTEDRESMKVELAKRVALAKATADEAAGWRNNLTKRLEDKPEGADLAPIIGETLAEHPHLGPLAHLWDRLRITGYNLKKGLHKGEATDEIPRIIARNVAAVLITGLMLHLGVFIPGLPGS